MFARRVSMHLKSNNAAEFTQKLEKDIIPQLRNEKGFQDEIVFVAPGQKDAVAISLWDRAESAEAYDRGTYKEVLKSLATLVEGTPQVKTYEVCNSTFHKIAVAV
jgi:quinol monooxygenase YgiN